jgi:hypothetical protein
VPGTNVVNAVYVRNTILNPSLGTDYTKKELLSRIGRQSTLLSNPEYKKNPFAIFTYPSNLQLVVKLQDCVKAQQNKTYTQKVKLTNLQQMANTLIFLQENNYDSIEQLKTNYANALSSFNNSQIKRNTLNQEIVKLNEQIHYLGQYYATKPYFTKMLYEKNKATFHKDHSMEISRFEEARKYLKSIYSTESVPSLQYLYRQRDQLKSDLKKINTTLHAQWKLENQLKIVLSNTNSLLKHENQRFVTRNNSLE